MIRRFACRQSPIPRLVFLKQAENLGMIGNFNACLKAARGELFLMLSDDDFLEQRAIEQLGRLCIPRYRWAS